MEEFRQDLGNRTNALDNCFYFIWRKKSKIELSICMLWGSDFQETIHDPSCEELSKGMGASSDWQSNLRGDGMNQKDGRIIRSLRRSDFLQLSVRIHFPRPFWESILILHAKFFPKIGGREDMRPASRNSAHGQGRLHSSHLIGWKSMSVITSYL